MKYGFVKVAAATPNIRVADVKFNTERILEGIGEAESSGVQLLVFPELCVCGYTCGDLFGQDVLLDGCERALAEIAGATKGKKMLVFVGLAEKTSALHGTAKRSFSAIKSFLRTKRRNISRSPQRSAKICGYRSLHPFRMRSRERISSSIFPLRTRRREKRNTGAFWSVRSPQRLSRVTFMRMPVRANPRRIWSFPVTT